jgi:hypothetical protein
LTGVLKIRDSHPSHHGEDDHQRDEHPSDFYDEFAFHRYENMYYTDLLLQYLHEGFWWNVD